MMQVQDTGTDTGVDSESTTGDIQSTVEEAAQGTRQGRTIEQVA